MNLRRAFKMGESIVYNIIDGKAIAQQIKDECREEVARRKEKGIEHTFAVVQVGEDAASSVYVRNKKKGCAYIGIHSLSFELPEETSEAELLGLIDELNGNDQVTGILVQLPLPKHIDEDKIILAIAPHKDVDCFHPLNVGNLAINRRHAGDLDGRLSDISGHMSGHLPGYMPGYLPGYLPCTPAGVIELLKRSDIEIAGKECVVVGRSNIVGKPMALLLLRENGTVTVAHSQTRNLPEVTKRADILVVAAGRAKMITGEYVKEGAVVIDVGMHRDENGKLCGDVDFDSVAPLCRAITPVPGGVGPMTIAMLLRNCVM